VATALSQFNAHPTTQLITPTKRASFVYVGHVRASDAFATLPKPLSFFSIV